MCSAVFVLSLSKPGQGNPRSPNVGIFPDRNSFCFGAFTYLEKAGTELQTVMRTDNKRDYLLTPFTACSYVGTHSFPS